MTRSSIQSVTSHRRKWKYDVFVSFRGEDTRNNFTDHLFGALHKNRIVVFRDDINVKKGGNISSELLQAIEESHILIVIFSKNYASSTWCLRELANIADCIRVQGQTVLPIFYDVRPSEVRKQTGDYENAFLEHEERFKGKEVQRWRGALTQVANLSGWDIKDKSQYAEIEKIIKKVRSLLGNKTATLPGDIVGMHSQVEELENFLILDSNDDVRVVGICGIGGIGKTTLAKALCARISNQFAGCCFIDDVSKTYRDYGPIGVQKQLLCQTLNEENLEISNHSTGSNLIQTRLCQMKSLVVLDNVDKVEQLDQLAITRDCLGTGSRIIVISRDGHILRENGVDEVYKVQPLDHNNALQLFCMKAFKSDDIMSGYGDLTDDVLKYTNGLPLAIKVLGSFLYGREVSVWRSALERLRENPSPCIMDVLRISFDGLHDTEKNLFLDIACLFDRDSETYVKKKLDIRGFLHKIGLKVLIDKSFITSEMRRICMHDLFKELGKSIVREKSIKEPRKWNRLWDYKDVHKVISENMVSGPETVELNVTMHCEACAEQLQRKILQMRGVQTAVAEFSTRKVTVTGTMDANKLVDYVYKRTKKQAKIVPKPENKEGEKPADEEEAKPKENEGEKAAAEEEAKPEGGNTAAEEAKPEENEGEKAAAEEEAKPEENKKEEEKPTEEPKKEEGGEESKEETKKEESGAVVNIDEEGMKRMMYYREYLRFYMIEHTYAPQLFSDENPNGCSIS